MGRRVKTSNQSSPEVAVDMPLLAPGVVLDGKFQVERVLGRGGMGQVVAAMHLQLRERVALKFLLPSAAHKPGSRARFLREARATVKLRSDHVARVIDVGTLAGDLPYMVMEYLEGEDLQSMLGARGALPVREAIDLLLQAMEGVAEAHAQDIVHRDLKPSNLFVSITRDGEHVVKVLDFGISKMLGAGDDALAADLTQTSSALGSPMYMSPEQVRSTKQVDSRSDVWSLGVILYEMLAGCPPWRADSVSAVTAMIAADDPPSLRALRPDIPPALEALVLRALAKPIDERIQNVGAFAAALNAVDPSPHGQDSFERISRVLGGSRRRLPRSREPSHASIVILPESSGRAASIPDSALSPITRSLKPPRQARWAVVAIAGVAIALVAAIGVEWVSARGPNAAAAPTVAAASASSPLAPASMPAAASQAPVSAPIVAPSAPPPSAMPSASTAPTRPRARGQSAPNPFADRE